MCIFTTIWCSITLVVIGALIAGIGDASDQAEHNSKLIETSCAVSGGQLNSKSCSACPSGRPQRRSEKMTEGRRKNELKTPPTRNEYQLTVPSTRRDDRRRSCQTQTYTCYDITFSVSLNVPRSKYGNTKDLVTTTTKLPHENGLFSGGDCESCYTANTANGKLDFWTSSQAPKATPSERSLSTLGTHNDTGVRCFYHPDDPKNTVTFDQGSDDASAAVAVLIVIILFIACCFGGVGCFLCYRLFSACASTMSEEVEFTEAELNMQEHDSAAPQAVSDSSEDKVDPNAEDGQAQPQPSADAPLEGPSSEVQLPEGWKATKDSQGKTYYYKPGTQISQYEFPQQEFPAQHSRV